MSLDWYESHCHTPLCGHAVGEPEAYAAAALERGLSGIHITCHGPTEYEWSHCMRRAQWPLYVAMCERARDAFAGQLPVEMGIECDYLPGMEPYWKKFLGENRFGHVLGSIHPQMDVFRERFWRGDEFAFQKTYFDLLAQAAESGLFDTLSHPDLVKNSTPRHWDLGRIMPHIEQSLDRIAAAGTAMELNTSGLQKTISEMNPGREMLCAMRARGIAVVVGADAHVPERVGADFDAAIAVLASSGYNSVAFFVQGERHEIGLQAAAARWKAGATQDGATRGT